MHGGDIPNTGSRIYYMVIFCTLAHKAGGNNGHNAGGNMGPLQIQNRVTFATGGYISVRAYNRSEKNRIQRKG